jgi:hypothetical protein
MFPKIVEKYKAGKNPEVLMGRRREKEFSS